VRSLQKNLQSCGNESRVTSAPGQAICATAPWLNSATLAQKVLSTSAKASKFMVVSWHAASLMTEDGKQAVH